MSWFRDLFTRGVRKDLDYIASFLKDEIARLREDLCVLSKKCKQYESLEIYEVTSLFGNFSLCDKGKMMEMEREEARKKGYSFCFKRKNGTEIWMKYPK